jgi:hypothetical protein
MTWLQQKKTEFAEKEAAELAKIEADRKLYKDNLRSSQRQLKDFISKHFEGVPVTVIIDKVAAMAKVFYKNEPLLNLYFRHAEIEEYDKDNCLHGTGHCYLKREVKYLKAYRNEYNSEVSETWIDVYDNDEDLARYILQYCKV